MIALKGRSVVCYPSIAPYRELSIVSPAEGKRVIVVRSSHVSNAGRMQNTLRMLSEAGFETSAYCWDRLAEHPKFETMEGCTVRNSHVRGAYGRRSLLFYTPLWWVFEFFYLLFHRVDCIYATDIDTVVPALCVKVFKRTKVIFDVYDFFADRHTNAPELRPILGALERFCAHRADAVLVPDKARLHNFRDRLPKRLIIAENCPYDRTDPNQEKPLNADLVIFYAGAIMKYRGLEKLIYATNGLPGVRVVIAGRILDPECGALIEKADQVEFLGLVSREEAVRRTIEADAIYCYYDPVIPNNRAANSTKMFEALMCSTAVIMNSEPPTARLVAEYDCGSCLPFEDDEGLRAVIEAWSTDHALARQAGLNARRAFEERFNWERVSAPILELFQEWDFI